MSARRLVAVVGATGTGKSDLAIALAQEFNGEVISVDAYQIFRGLDIGTAKVVEKDRSGVPHHLIDIAEPNEPFTLALYLDAAHSALDDIWARPMLPILAGGSGQHIWALLEGWQVPRVPPDTKLRQELETQAAHSGAEAIVSRLRTLDPDAADQLDPQNARRLIRAIEIVTHTGLSLAASQKRDPIDADVLTIGLGHLRPALYERLDSRVDQMFAAGFVTEVEKLRASGFTDSTPIRGGVGYRQVSAYLDGEYELEEAIRRTKNAHHRLARRQAGWFREQDTRIRWLMADQKPASEASTAVREWLSSPAGNVKPA